MAMIKVYFFRNLAEFASQRSMVSGPQAFAFLRTLTTCFEIFLVPSSVPDVAAAAVSAGAKIAPRDRRSVNELIATWKSIAQGREHVELVLLPRIEAGWLEWRTAAYIPLPSNPALTVHSTRLTCKKTMGDAIAAAMRWGCRLFVGPEGFFHKGTAQCPVPFSLDDMEDIHAWLRSTTAAVEHALFIPGTAYWVDAENKVHNSLLAYSAGVDLCADKPYDKKEWTDAEKNGVPKGCTPCIGETPYWILSWQTLTLCVQICADSGTKFSSNCDIHIIVGNQTGLALLRNRVGGIGVQADASGVGFMIDSFAKHTIKAGDARRVLNLAWTPILPEKEAPAQVSSANLPHLQGAV